MKNKFYILLLLVVLLAGCGNKNEIVSVDADGEDISEALGASVLKYKISINDMDYSTVKMWVEKYVNGEKEDTELPILESSYEEKTSGYYTVLLSNSNLSQETVKNFNLQIFSSNEKRNVKIKAMSDIILDKNDVKNGFNASSWGIVEDINNAKIEPNKAMNIGVYTFNNAAKHSTIIENINLYDDETIFREKAKNYDVVYVVKVMFSKIK